MHIVPVQFSRVRTRDWLMPHQNRTLDNGSNLEEEPTGAVLLILDAHGQKHLLLPLQPDRIILDSGVELSPQANSSAFISKVPNNAEHQCLADALSMMLF
ncbi:hypothetical protein DITRI_Ditri17bG0020000 [Diplodiscus trichospermus]